jgi:DNA-binding IclR family transcriptional regulator
MLKTKPETSVETERPLQLGIQSVEVAGELLQALLLAEGPVKLADLARMAGMPSAKAHRYLVSLMRIGLASQDAVTGRYDLGPVAMQFGVKGFTRFEPLRFAEHSVRELVDQVGETAGIAAWSERGPIFVRLIEARHDLATSIGPLHACPLTYSATGLLFCVFEDAQRTDKAIERELDQNRRSGRVGVPHSRAELAEILLRVRRQGFATIVDGGGDGYGAVSAPVFDITGRLAMAVTVFGRAGRVDASPEGALSRVVSATAQKLSTSLGYRGQR